MAGRGAQRGWVGLVVILIALVIVALLAQTALKSYGLLSGTEASSRPGARLPAAARPAPVDAASEPAPPANAIARARGLGQQMQRDAEDEAKRIDAATP